MTEADYSTDYHLSEFKQLVAFLHLLAHYRDEETSIYNAMAPGYDCFAKAWNESFAKPALDALFAHLVRRTPPEAAVLDAGCGTGRHVQTILDQLNPASVVGVDLAERMLDMARRRSFDNRVSFMRGNLLSLPFADNSFDAVVAIWTLETMSQPSRAVQEFLRVLKPGGVVAYSFIQMPETPEAVDDLVENALLHTGWELGEALAPWRLPFHDCSQSSLKRFHHGIISVTTLSKCCTVQDTLLP